MHNKQSQSSTYRQPFYQDSISEDDETESVNSI
jgi:hypothetical protein